MRTPTSHGIFFRAHCVFVLILFDLLLSYVFESHCQGNFSASFISYTKISVILNSVYMYVNLYSVRPEVFIKAIGNAYLGQNIHVW